MTLSSISIIGVKKISKRYRNTDTILGRVSGIINWDNNIEVQSTTLDINKIKVNWLTHATKTKKVFGNGKYRSKIGNHYGLNKFILEYDQTEFYRAGHFKTNNWHAHHYEFRIEREKDSYFLDFSAAGPDSMQITDTILILRD